MIGSIFHPWVAGLNAKLRIEHRNGILFLDNFSGHVMGVEQCSADDLSNLRIEWLPRNCTSICQPVDQGIGQALKIRYRKYLHEHMANMVFAGKPPMTMVNILKACNWLSRAWNSLNNTNTVRRCFVKAGFTFPGPEDGFDSSAYDELAEEDEGALMAEEREIADPHVNNDPTSLLESYINDLNTANDDDDEEVEEDTAGGVDELEEVQNKTPIITATQANQMLKELERFFETKDMVDAATWSSDLG